MFPEDLSSESAKTKCDSSRHENIDGPSSVENSKNEFPQGFEDTVKKHSDELRRNQNLSNTGFWFDYQNDFNMIIEDNTLENSSTSKYHNQHSNELCKAFKELNYPAIEFLVKSSIDEPFNKVPYRILVYLTLTTNGAITEESVAELNSFNFKMFDLFEKLKYYENFRREVDLGTLEESNYFKNFMTTAFEKSLRAGNFAVASYILFNPFLSPFASILPQCKNTINQISLFEEEVESSFSGNVSMDNYLNIYRIVKLFHENRYINQLNAIVKIVQAYPKIGYSFRDIHMRLEDTSYFDLLNYFHTSFKSEYKKFVLQHCVHSKSLKMLKSAASFFKVSLDFDNRLLLKNAIEQKWFEGCAYLLRKGFKPNEDNRELVEVIANSNFDGIINLLLLKHQDILPLYDNYILKSLVESKNYVMIEKLLSLTNINPAKVSMHMFLHSIANHLNIPWDMLSMKREDYINQIVNVVDRDSMVDNIIIRAIQNNDFQLFKYILDYACKESIMLDVDSYVPTLINLNNVQFLSLLSDKFNINLDLITVQHFKDAITNKNVEMFEFILSLGHIEPGKDIFGFLICALYNFEPAIFKQLVDHEDLSHSYVEETFYNILTVAVVNDAFEAVSLVMQSPNYRILFYNNCELYNFAVTAEKFEMADMILSFVNGNYSQFVDSVLASEIIDYKPFKSKSNFNLISICDQTELVNPDLDLCSPGTESGEVRCSPLMFSEEFSNEFVNSMLVTDPITSNQVDGTSKIKGLIHFTPPKVLSLSFEKSHSADDDDIVPNSRGVHDNMILESSQFKTEYSIDGDDLRQVKQLQEIRRSSKVRKII